MENTPPRSLIREDNSQPPETSGSSDISLNWTFGVELEMCVAYLLEEERSCPDPTDTRHVQFDITMADIGRLRALGVYREFKTRSEFEEFCRMQDGEAYHWQETVVFHVVRRHMANSLLEAGFPISTKALVPLDADTSLWEITSDTIIDAPATAPKLCSFDYDWVGLELKSPALPFCRENLKKIEAVCAFLQKRYVMVNPESTGLHVHVSSSKEVYKFETLQNLYAFIWAFEPQIKTLHPQHRHENQYCMPLRSRARLRADKEITILQGVFEILKVNNMESLLQSVTNPVMARFAYDAMNMIKYINGDGRRPTIEFRQHEGTIDGERVSNWVMTVIGIIDFLDNIELVSLIELLSVAQHETWEKQSDRENQQREKQNGPILAEGKWTIIDLLKHIGLEKSAEYYSSRLSVVESPDMLVPLTEDPFLVWQSFMAEFKSTAVGEAKMLGMPIGIWEKAAIEALQNLGQLE